MYKERPTELVCREDQELIRCHLQDMIDGGTHRYSCQAMAILILLRAGLRSQELCDLKVCDIYLDRTTPYIYVASGKGSKARRVSIDTVLSPVLSWFIPRHAGKTYLLETRSGKKWLTCQLRKMVSSFGKHIGMQNRLHAHGLRATMATDMLNEGFSLEAISAQLGHSNVSTTAIYIKRVANAHLDILSCRGGWDE